MRLIDSDALKKSWSMGDNCEDCQQNARTCQYEQDFTRMDICEMLDEAPTVGGWISVKDRLPDIRRVDYLGESWNESDEVLVYVKDVPENFRHIYVAYISEGVWHSDDDGWFNNYTVIHWMPLPEPPKEGNDD